MRLALCIGLVSACLSGFSAPAAGLWGSSSKELDRQVDQLVDQISASLAGKKVGKLAITEFPTLEGKSTELGKLLSEELTTRLFRTGRFQIIERQMLARVLEEQKLGASGVVDESTASRLGRLLGADALAIGTLADLGSTVRVNARLISSETGSVLGVATAAIPVTGETEGLLGRKGAPRPGGLDPARFDGTWEVTFSCAAQDMGQPYTLRFLATVKDALFHGQVGNEARGSFMTFDGAIGPDGKAVLTATGVTGDPRWSMHHEKPGSPVSFHVNAEFTGNRGVGKRVEMRACDMIFTRR